MMIRMKFCINKQLRKCKYITTAKQPIPRFVKMLELVAKCCKTRKILYILVLHAKIATISGDYYRVWKTKVAKFRNSKKVVFPAF